MIQVAFDTLDFANKLKAAGLDAKIAETQAELQASLQNNINEKLEQHQTIITELTKNELATKEDINRLETQIDMVENRLLVKLGGTIVSCCTALGILATFFHVIH